MIDSNDLTLAVCRISDFTELLDVAACYWGNDRPVSEFPGVVSTACQILRLLLDELIQVIDALEAGTFKTGDTEQGAEISRPADDGSAADEDPTERPVPDGDPAEGSACQ